MDNKIGDGVIQYRNVFIRSSIVGNDSILADDTFITDSVIGTRCTIQRRGMVFSSKMGDYSYLGFNTIIKHSEIGKFCSISWNDSIGGANHDYSKISTHPFDFVSKYGFTEQNGNYESFETPLVIGNDVWIGANVTILRGVTIGDGAVIGGGSVVTKNIPPYAIVVGNPGRVLKYRFPDEIISELLRLRWWDWPKDFIKMHLDFFQRHNITFDDLKELNEKYLAFSIGKR